MTLKAVDFRKSDSDGYAFLKTINTPYKIHYHTLCKHLKFKHSNLPHKIAHFLPHKRLAQTHKPL